VTSRRAQRGVRGWHIKTGPAPRGRTPGRWGRRVATPGSLTGVAHLARLPHTICRKRMQVQTLRAVPGRVLRIRIVLELEQDAAGHRRCRGEQGERVRREAARVDVQPVQTGSAGSRRREWCAPPRADGRSLPRATTRPPSGSANRAARRSPASRSPAGSPSDLARAHAQPALRPGRSPRVSGRTTALLANWTARAKLPPT
jgi:hypothetical protein